MSVLFGTFSVLLLQRPLFFAVGRVRPARAASLSLLVLTFRGHGDLPTL